MKRAILIPEQTEKAREHRLWRCGETIATAPWMQVVHTSYIVLYPGQLEIAMQDCLGYVHLVTVAQVKAVPDRRRLTAPQCEGRKLNIRYTKATAPESEVDQFIAMSAALRNTWRAIARCAKFAR